MYPTKEKLLNKLRSRNDFSTDNLLGADDVLDDVVEDGT